MAEIKFKKDYPSEVVACSFGIGWLDTEKTFHDEGEDYLAEMIYVEIDDKSFRIERGKDIIDKSELDSLQEVSTEEYERWSKFLELVRQKAKAMHKGVESPIFSEV